MKKTPLRLSPPVTQLSYDYNSRHVNYIINSTLFEQRKIAEFINDSDISYDTYNDEQYFEDEITPKVCDERPIEENLTKIGMLEKENQELKKSNTLLTKQINELLQHQDELLSHEEVQKNSAVLDPSSYFSIVPKPNLQNIQAPTTTLQLSTSKLSLPEHRAFDMQKRFGFYYRYVFYPVNLPDNLTFEQLISKYEEQKRLLESSSLEKLQKNAEYNYLNHILNETMDRTKHMVLKIKVLEKECNNLRHEVVNLIQQKNEAIMQKRTLSEQAQIDYYGIIKYIASSKPDFIPTIQWDTLKELFIQIHVEDPRNRRYTNRMKDFSFIISNQSPKAFKTLSMILPFPCYDTVRRHVSQTISRSESQYLSISKIATTISDYCSSFEINTKPILASLAIDAIAVNPEFLPFFKTSHGRHFIKPVNEQILFTTENLGDKRRDVFTEALNQKEEKDIKSKAAIIDNIFVYYIEPFDASLQCFPVFLYLKHGGNADQVIRRLTEMVTNEIEKTQIVIANISTDGDPGYQELYDHIVNELIKLEPDLHIQHLLNNEDCFKIKRLVSSDLLHLFKTFRVRFLSYDINLFPTHTTNIMKSKTLQSLFKKGVYLTDLTQIGKMKDQYVKDFFSLENMQKIIEKKDWTTVFIFLPFVMWVTATMDQNVDVNTSLCLLKCAYELILFIYHAIKEPDAYDKTTKQVNHGTPQYLTVSTISVMNRMIATLFSLIFVMTNVLAVNNETDAKIPPKEWSKYSQITNFGIERIVTHPLENLNGLIRESSHSYDSISNACASVAKGHLQKKLKIKHRIKYSPK